MIARFVLAAGWLCVAQLATAETLLHRQAPGRTFGISSDTALLDDFGRPTSELVADKFTLAESADACRVNAWALYGGSDPFLDPPPPATETIRVRVYQDAAGLPGAVLQEELFLNPPRTWTGMFVALSPLRKEHLFELALSDCFAAEGGVSYWLEVAQVGDVQSRFRWENSNTPGEYAVQFPIGDPWHITTGSGQMAYELWTPEPCTGAMLALGFGVMLRRGKR